MGKTEDQMSDHAQAQINSIVNWFMKIVLAVCAFLITTTFIDIKDNIKNIGSDVYQIKLEFVEVKSATLRNADAINDLRINKQNKIYK